MRKKLALIVTIGAASLVIIGAAMAFMFMRREPEWTTSSDAALREFNLGQMADRKYYEAEAREHYERALELDPNFVIAKFRLLEKTREGAAGREKMKRELEGIDQSKLNERERFMIRHQLARLNRNVAAADQILDSYLRQHPNDPFAVNRLCEREWDKRNWPEAEKCYRRLIELEPNWVLAQNHLGYIAMAQGRFKEAEDLFKMYRYIAPDQANPHDSLGELLTLMGRYDEAEKAFSEALATRGDFCASYNHLIEIAFLREDFDKAESILDRSRRAGCDKRYVEGMSCGYEIFRAYQERRWNDAVDAAKTNDCFRKGPPFLMLGVAAALKSGREADADHMEQTYREERKKAFSPYRPSHKDPALLHLEGLRLASRHEYAAAAEKFREADEQLVFWGNGQGIFKLYNQLILARALDRAGRRNEAREWRAAVEAVNPRVDETMNRFVF